MLDARRDQRRPGRACSLASEFGFKPVLIAVRSIPAHAPAPVNQWYISFERLSATTLKIKEIAGKSRTPGAMQPEQVARLKEGMAADL
jgi:hypothetical protein